jgi:Leucine-rich repeat (LRR) protein
VNDGLLMISVNAFKDSFGECGLNGNLTFRDCNLRQFDSAVLNNCNQLKKIAFIDSHVESLIDVPTLRNLNNFTVYSPRQWTGAPQRGLSRLALAPGASLPLVTYLDLSGNSLGDNSIEFVSKQTSIEEMHLEGNNFAAVPNLTDCFNLHTFTMTLNSSSSVSILLPDPRDQTQPLEASFDSTSKTVHDVISLEGIFF